MNVIMTKDRPINENKKKAWKRCHQALKAANVGEPIDLSPADYTDDPLLRVLIVDDHRATTDTLASLAGIWGHDVRRAYDGVTGLALAAAFRPDVMLLDMLMPEMSGFEVAMQVRRQDRLQHCFIVAVTGRTDAKHRAQCYEAGADLSLIKPVPTEHMRTLLALELERVKGLSDSATIAGTCREFSGAY